MHSTRTSRVVRWTAALIVVIAAGAALYWSRYATYHFAEVQCGVLYRDGNRSLRELDAACRRAGVRTIVMLNDDDELKKEPFRSEAEFCRARGIRLERIAIPVGHRPSSEDVRQFLRIMADERSRPVLVHCAQGVRRTGMIVAAYQRSVMSCTAEQAKSAIVPWGRRGASLDDIRGFIDDYDPATQTIGAAHVISRPQEGD